MSTSLHHKPQHTWIVAFIIFFCSCSSHSTRNTNPTFSEFQMDSLVQEIMLHTPEYTHYGSGYKFNWVLFSPPEDDEHPEITTKIRLQLKRKYIVYDALNHLPAELISYDTNDPVGAPIYHRGFMFSVKIHRVDKNTIEVDYEDFENSLAAGSQTFRYRWLNNRWKVIWKSELIVA